MLIIILKTHKADFLERRQSALKTTTTITTSFLSFKMYENGGREKNLIYVNNSKGLREQKQYKWTKRKEFAGGLYTALLSVKQCSTEGHKWQRFWKTPWYHPTLKNKWRRFGTPVPTYISSGGAKKKLDSQLIQVVPLTWQGRGLKARPNFAKWSKNVEKHFTQ